MPTTRARRQKPHLLEGLGLIGLDDIEPVVVAATAAELPMLLVGPHGTGKSLLLTRVADALGLTWRHDNAGLLNYDDLIGYPAATPGGLMGSHNACGRSRRSMTTASRPTVSSSRLTWSEVCP